MDKVCTGCGRFESDGPIGDTFLSCCPDSDYQEINVNMKDLIVFYKSQAKEIEGLKEWISKAPHLYFCKWNYTGLQRFDCDCDLHELLKEVK
jgi:hypothetical protein